MAKKRGFGVCFPQQNDPVTILPHVIEVAINDASALARAAGVYNRTLQPNGRRQVSTRMSRMCDVRSDPTRPLW
jgi:hypothetical protein